MEPLTRDLEPWQVPPDEAYWRALLREGEYGEGAVGAAHPSDTSHNPTPLDPAPALIGSPAHTAQAPAAFAPGAAERSDEDVNSVAGLADVPSRAVENAPPEDVPDQPDDDPSPASQTLAGEPGCWELFDQYQASGELVDLTVEGFNRGGLLARWMDVLGFIPASQLCDGLRYEDERSRLDDLADRVGQQLTVRVIEVDGLKNRLIFSERAARHIEDPDLGVLDTIQAGDVCHGEITNLCTFGAFVDLGGIEGLIHISELSWGRVGHPSDVLQSGQEVEVYVLNVDREQGRVGLSIKRLQPDPWDKVEERYDVDQVVAGTVTNIVNFGAFVRLEEGLEGLIHASELAGGVVPSPYALREGEQIMVRINSIEGARHRIGLSLEQP